MEAFTAIDFETANHGADSACAVGLVRVEHGRIVRRERRLIRPPSRDFFFTHIHGLSWKDVETAPTFAQAWPALVEVLEGVDYLAAHNASFDRRVLNACCRSHCLRDPSLPFVCTVDLARRLWGIRPTRLPDVCRHLSIPLRHHDPASDAEACAQIVVTAQRAGWRYLDR